MSNYFKTHGRTLIANGYLIIPISAGHKFPALKNWETSRFTAMQLDGHPNCGVGILCGQGAEPLAAIDIDTTNEILAQQMTAWCFEHLGVTCERIGNAPKILLPYRAHEAGWRKATGKWFVDKAGGKHRIEILGHGQQFVAYHIHPDTKKPYVWTDIFGGFEAMRADDLPVIELDQVQEALAEFERLAQINGLTLKTGGTTLDGKRSTAAAPSELAAEEPPVGLPMARAKVLLEHVDAADYETWLKVGMSLHHEYKGSDAALALWDEWSSQAPNYVGEEDLLKRWDHFGEKGHRPVTIRWLMKHGRETRKVAEHTVKRNALEEARDAIVQCNDTIELLGDIARQAGEAAGSDLAIRAELEGLIRVRFKALTLSKTPLPLQTVRIAMGAARREEPPPSTVVEDDNAGIANKRRERTEFGNAERMLDQHGDSLLYSPQLDRWFMWTGVYWRGCAAIEIGDLAKKTIRALPAELEFISGQVEREAFYKFAAASQKASMVHNMIFLAQSDPRVMITAQQLDYRKELLGVHNGAVDLTTGELLAPDPLHRITMQAAVEYDPKAEAPLWRRTVAEVFFGDCEMIDFFQRLVGHALLGDPKEDILVIPHGGGSNGKSTVLGTIRQLLGDYAKGCSAETFLTKGEGQGGNAGAAREDLLRLRNARFVYVSEPEEGSELRESLIKKVTGGDVIEARGLWARSTVEFTPTWVPFIPTNHKPIVKGSDVGIWRRLMLVPFTRNFETDKETVKDEDRAKKLMAEYPGILRWCVEGALAYQEMGLKPPGRISQARAEYKQDMDLLGEWIERCLEPKPGAITPLNEAFSSWEVFARGRGDFQYVRTARALGRRLEHRFEVSYEGSQRKVIGVELRPRGLDQ